MKEVELMWLHAWLLILCGFLCHWILRKKRRKGVVDGKIEMGFLRSSLGTCDFVSFCWSALHEVSWIIMNEITRVFWREQESKIVLRNITIKELFFWTQKKTKILRQENFKNSPNFSENAPLIVH